MQDSVAQQALKQLLLVKSGSANTMDTRAYSRIGICTYWFKNKCKIKGPKT
jgi:hypothetical protein